MSDKFRLLLVDDQPTNLQVLGSILSKNYDLQIATSGAQALKLLAGDQRADVILLDVMMPDMDGHEVCRRLKAEPATAKIPVIFVTALDQDEDLQKGLELGAVDYITKPIKPLVVHARVDNQIKLLQKQRELEQAQKELESSNQELEQFAYAVSHDLRQPLRMIASYLGLLRRGLLNKLTAEQQGFLNTAELSAGRLDTMILGLLNYSRVGRVQADFTEVNSRDALDMALTFLNREIDQQTAEIKIEGRWPKLSASEQELIRLFQNLISNALKYVPRGAAARIEVTSKVEENNWRVEVKDAGIGIEPEQQDRLFKMFSRLHTRKEYEGNGVGLALCRKIIEHHQGEIGVKSAGAGRGSTFWFCVPLQGPAVSASERD